MSLIDMTLVPTSSALLEQRLLRQDFKQSLIYSHLKAVEMSPIYTIFIFDPYHENGVTLFRSRPSHKVILPNDALKARWRDVADAVLILFKMRLSKDEFAKQKKLKVVVKQGVDVNNVDLEAIKKHGVMVRINTPRIETANL